MRYVVQAKEDIINKIIPHFDSYPLLTLKSLNFNIFKEASKIVVKGDHLKKDGINEILYLKNIINKNRDIKDNFYYYANSKTLDLKLNPNWVLGFIDGEGCFGTLITKSKEGKIVTRNRLSVSQSTHDYMILKAIKDFFNAGYLSPKEDSILDNDASFAKNYSFYYNSTPETIIPFFDKYQLLTRKYLDYQDFKKFYYLKKDKIHLTESGLMKYLALRMNSGRDDILKSKRNKDQELSDSIHR